MKATVVMIDGQTTIKLFPQTHLEKELIKQLNYSGSDEKYNIHVGVGYDNRTMFNNDDPKHIEVIIKERKTVNEKSEREVAQLNRALENKKITKQKLWGNKWINVMEADGWFTYSNNAAGTGEGVSVLGFKEFNGGAEAEFLIRSENNPAHGGFINCSLTGTIETGDTPLYTAKKELLEESGYSAEESEFIYLGWVYPSKFSDYRQHLYAVDLTGKMQGDLKGDGTFGEEGASVFWLPMNEAIQLNYPSIGSTMLRLALYKDKEDQGVDKEVF